MALSLGEKLRTLRKKSMLTLDRLAETVGISKSYLWELENRPQAKPSAEILDKLAVALGVPIGYLLDESATLLGENHLDEVFFRNYQKLGSSEKEQLRRILDTFRKS